MSAWRLLLVLVLWLPACGSGEDTAWFARVDTALSAPAGSPDASLRLRAAWALPVPSSVAPDDARVLRQDIAFRLASLELAASPRNAHETASAGLKLGRASDVFTTNLLIVRGKASEALGDDKQAATDYYDAMVVAEGMLQHEAVGK